MTDYFLNLKLSEKQTLDLTYTVRVQLTDPQLVDPQLADPQLADDNLRLTRTVISLNMHFNLVQVFVVVM